MTALEPPVLTLDNNPIEVEAWMEQYTAYHKASKFDALDIEEQRAFIRKKLSVELWQHIYQHVNEDTQIFQEHGLDSSRALEPSIFELSNEAFELKYPIITRRLEFFNSKPCYK